MPNRHAVVREAPPHTMLNSSQSSGAGPSTYSTSTMQRSVSDTPLDDEYDYGGGDPDAEADESIFRDMTFDEVLEDLNARFLVNLPAEERPLVRLYWQAEQAHWFYEDYLRPLNPHLPSLGQRHFTQLIIASSPLLNSLSGPNGIDYDHVWNDYISYKSMVPCCGAIILNKDGDKCLVVRGWKSNAGWSFPRGKININEPEMLCAIREVEEETGFDLTGLINETDRIQTQVNSQSVTMYIVAGVDEATIFEAQTKNEIGAIEWVKTSELPTWTGKKPKKSGATKEKKFYNVTPFVGPLKKWLSQHGYNPHPPNKKKQPKHTQDNRRNLQPFFEDSSPLLPAPTPLAQTSQATQDKAASALDHLFDRFITKQEEDLLTDRVEAVAGPGQDQVEGMKRLFRDLGMSDRERAAAEQASAKRDDDDLVRLLGGVSVLPTVPPPSEKANRLLSLLKPTAVRAEPPPPSAHPQSAPTEGSGGGPTPMMRPHQASLLSMLSPASRAPAITPPAPPIPHLTPSALSANPQPPSDPAFFGYTKLPPAPASPQKFSPASASPQSPSDGEEEAARREKQRKLLEMTMAGLGLGPATFPGQTAQQADTLPHRSQPPFSSDVAAPSKFYPPQSPQKPPAPSPSGGHTAHHIHQEPHHPAPPPPPPHHPTRSSPTKRVQHQHTGSTSSPTNPGGAGQANAFGPNAFANHGQGGFGSGPTGSQGFGPGHPVHAPPQLNAGQVGYQGQRPQPGTAEQQRLLAALQARPPPQSNQHMGGSGYPRQGHGPVRGGGGYQMGVPGQPGQDVPPHHPGFSGQPGQEHMPSNLTFNTLPPASSQYHPQYPSGHSGGMPPHPQVPHQYNGQGAYRPPYPQQPLWAQPPGNAIPPQPGHYPPSGPNQNFGQAPPGPGHQSRHSYSSTQQPGYQAQGQGQNHFGPGPVRTQQGPNQAVLQPVPMPRQATLGLLAMINGTGDPGR